jgi:hypothetical protein
MIKKIIFLFSIAASSVILVIFFMYVSKTGAYDEFMYARSKISAASSLACGIENTLEGFTADEKTAIFKIPSITSDNMIIPGYFDYCAVVLSNNILIFSIIPSPSTDRKHLTLYYKNFPPCVFNSSGNILEFTCVIRGISFQDYSSVIPDFLPVPEKGKGILK